MQFNFKIKSTSGSSILCITSACVEGISIIVADGGGEASADLDLKTAEHVYKLLGAAIAAKSSEFEFVNVGEPYVSVHTGAPF